MSKAKGRRSEKKVVNYLESEGWITDRTELGGKFTKYRDMYAGYCTNCWQRCEDCCDNPDRFEGFDIIATKKGTSAYIQIKTNQPSVQKNYKRFAKKYAGEGLEIYVMTWYSYKGLRIQQYLPSGKIKETDLRK
ncbi:MAG TPA: hypothetical protein VLA13_07020 [Massilibacterium sp.]|nr:hypothetical protein [Massilibacterium sp.]